MLFTKEEYQRYSRQIVLKELGPLGQNQLKKAKVLIVGVGGLGAPAALYLAASGVGTIGLLDADVVSVSNLQRQIIYRTADAGEKKVIAAKKHLEALNPHVHVEAYDELLTEENAEILFSQYDIVMDGTDNFKARYLINDTCVQLGKPFVYGSVYQFEGQVSLFAEGNGPCFRCIYPKPIASHEVPSCTEAGVLGVVPGLIALAEVNEIIKWITGIGETLSGKMMILDAQNFSWDGMVIHKNSDCPCCASEAKRELLRAAEVSCEVLNHPVNQARVHISELHALLTTNKNHYVLVDVRTEAEWQLGTIVGAKRIPVQQIELSLDELKQYTDRPILFICQRGNRSLKACALMKAAGLENVIDLEGGMHAWYETYMTHLEFLE